jgi:hypothetical protein
MSAARQESAGVQRIIELLLPGRNPRRVQPAVEKLAVVVMDNGQVVDGGTILVYESC